MTVLSQAGPSARTTPLDHQPRVVVSAVDVKTLNRIGEALTAHGLDPSLQAGDPSDLFDLDVDADAILILACDVDAASEMTALRRLRREQRGPSIVVISPPTTGTGIRRALEAGADAVVFAPELESTLAAAVSAVACGQSVVPRKVRASVERPALSHRERQVLTFVSAGLTNAQIAEQLFLSESTIKSHLSSGFAKLGVRSRREAATLFRELERTATTKIDSLAQEGATA